MVTHIIRVTTVLIVLCGFAGTASASTLEAPVSLNMTINVTGPETLRHTSTGTNYRAKMLTVRFTNRDYLQILVDENVIPSIDGWKLVARWTAGEPIESYGFYLVKAGSEPIALDDDTGFDLDFGVYASAYNERWNNGTQASGNGTIKFATAFDMETDDGSFRMGGIGTGAYAIKPVIKGGAPVLVLNALRLTLLGGVTTSDLQGVVEMTLSIGKPKVVPILSNLDYGGKVPAMERDDLDITIISPSS